MKALSNPRFLAVYSGVPTVVFAVVVLGGAAMVRNQSFGIITARRINIVEPDGTVRLTISNRADFPGAWNRKKEGVSPSRSERGSGDAIHERRRNGARRFNLGRKSIA